MFGSAWESKFSCKKFIVIEMPAESKSKYVRYDVSAAISGR